MWAARVTTPDVANEASDSNAPSNGVVVCEKKSWGWHLYQPQLLLDCKCNAW